LPRKNGALVRAKFCETQINIHGERLERAALFLFGGDWQKEGGQKKGENGLGVGDFGVAGAVEGAEVGDVEGIEGEG
jgi:hypothetical protein